MHNTRTQFASLLMGPLLVSADWGSSVRSDFSTTKLLSLYSKVLRFNTTHIIGGSAAVRVIACRRPRRARVLSVEIDLLTLLEEIQHPPIIKT